MDSINGIDDVDSGGTLEALLSGIKLNDDNPKKNASAVDVRPPNVTITENGVSNLPRVLRKHTAFCLFEDTTAQSRDPVEINGCLKVVIPKHKLKGLGKSRRYREYVELVFSKDHAEKWSGSQIIPLIRGLQKAQEDNTRGTPRPQPIRKTLSKVKLMPKFTPLKRLVWNAFTKTKKERRNRKTELSSPLNNNSVVAKIADGTFHVSVTLQSIGSLSQRAYLNDEVMDYGLVKTLKSCGNYADIVLLPTYSWTMHWFFETITPQKLNSLYKLLTYNGSEPNLLRKKFLIMPIQREKHWILAIVGNPFPDENLILDMLSTNGSVSALKEVYTSWVEGVKKPYALIFDSMESYMKMKCDNYDDFIRDTVRMIEIQLPKIHTKIFEQLNLGGVSQMFSNFHFHLQYLTVKAPGQMNAEDCGIFCMAYIKLWYWLFKGVDSKSLQCLLKDFSDVFTHDDLLPMRVSLFDVIRRDCLNQAPHLLGRLDPHRVQIVGGIEERS